ncbi:MAG: hypothetical protein K8R35_06760 [Bacteroidales bacterium]|nr:hypothetical protein [Bacteroidales bacterium]
MGKAWITKEGKQVFSQPFLDLLNYSDWNNELPQLYERINSLADDRSFVILMAVVLEYHVDKLLRILLPNYEILLETSEFTFSIKLKILKASKLLPEIIFEFSELTRKIRNSFAHNLSFDNLEELKEGNKQERKLVNKLEQLCTDYSESLVYFIPKSNDYRMRFKDVASFAILALREYEPNIKGLRELIDKNGFERELSSMLGNKFNDLEDTNGE